MGHRQCRAAVAGVATLGVTIALGAATRETLVRTRQPEPAHVATTNPLLAQMIYDPYEERFVVVARDVDIDALASRILVAVSVGSERDGAWYVTAIPSALPAGNENELSWADSPRLGLDAQALYVTADLFGFFSGTFNDGFVWVVDKREFYAGGVAVVSQLDPTPGFDEFDLEPAGASFTARNGWTDGVVEYAHVFTLEDPLGAPRFVEEFVPLGAMAEQATCGDGIVGPGETCDPPGVPPGAPNECRPNCTFCGDGVLDGAQQLIANGDFETGVFGAWNLAFSGSGSFSISTPGTATPLSAQPTAPNPAGGTRYAVSDQFSSGTHALSQPFAVPPTAIDVKLTFQMFVNDWSGVGPIVGPQGLDHAGPPNQHARVDILTSGSPPFTTGAGVVATLYLGVDPGAPPRPYTSYAFDLTSIVVPGVTYVLRFADTGNQFVLNLGVDNVKVLAKLHGGEPCDDGGNVGGDGCSADCRIECPGMLFGQTVFALGETLFGWAAPQSVVFVRGDLAAVSSYSVLDWGSLPAITTKPAPETPAPHGGYYWLFRRDCPLASWSSGGAGELPGRDGSLP